MSYDFPTDMGYARTLWGLYSIKHYQLQEMLKKLYELYENNGNRRNLLISPETFNYLYGDDNDLENKVKSGFMLLRTDLRED